MPLISVCVPVYNLEMYIEECIESLLDQECESYEIVLVDNGSTDNSIKICKSYAKDYPDLIRYYKLPHPTVLNRATVYALNQSCGDYIHMVDGDDFVEKDYLNDIEKIIREEKPCIIMGRFKSFVEEGGVAIFDTDFKAELINNKNHDDALEYIFSVPNFHKTHWRCIIKREYIEQITTTDYDLVGRYGDMSNVSIWLLESKKIYFYDKAFYNYRRRAKEGMISNVYDSSTSDFFKSLLIYQSSLKDKKQNLDIKFIMVEILIKLFVSGSDYISENELDELATLVDKYYDNFIELKLYNRKISNELVNLVVKFGSLKGLKKFIEYKNRSLLSLVENKKYKNIYIFPMGVYGSGKARLLTNNSIKVSGYIDNDKDKHYKDFSGVKCYPFDDDILCINKNTDDSLVVIATIYRNLIPELESQVKKIGFNNIKII